VIGYLVEGSIELFPRRLALLGGNMRFALVCLSFSVGYLGGLFLNLFI